MGIQTNPSTNHSRDHMHPPPSVNPNSPKGGGHGGFHSDPMPSAPLRDSNNIVTPPPAKYLLGPLPPEDVGKKCLVLDLDETLVHSSFKPIPNADFIISIELENVIHRV